MITTPDLRALSESVEVTAPRDFVATVRERGRRRARRAARFQAIGLVLVIALCLGATGWVSRGDADRAELSPAQVAFGPTDDALRQAAWWSTEVIRSEGVPEPSRPQDVRIIVEPLLRQHWSRSGSLLSADVQEDGSSGPLVRAETPLRVAAGLTTDQLQALPSTQPALLEALVGSVPVPRRTDALFGGAVDYVNSPALLPVRRALLDALLAGGRRAAGRDSLGRSGIVITRVTGDARYEQQLVVDLDVARILEETLIARDSPREFARETLIGWSTDAPASSSGD